MTRLSALILAIPRLGAYMTLRLALAIVDAAERLRGTPAPPPVLCLGCGKPLRGHAREERDRCKDAVRRAWSSGKMPMPRVPADPLRVPWAGEDPAPVGSWWAMRVNPEIVRLVVQAYGPRATRRVLADEHGVQFYLATDVPLVADRCKPPLFSRRRAIETAAGLAPYYSDRWLPKDGAHLTGGEPSPPAPVPAVERLRACSDFARPRGGGK